MRVILETARVGRGFEQQAGEEIDLPNDEANRLIAAGSARRIESAAINHNKRDKAVARRDWRN